MAASNALATTLKSLHIPGKPLILTNVYDILSARAVAALPSCKALATASYAVARANGTEDDDMDAQTNLRAVLPIAKVAAEFKKPLTVDIQDAYGEQLEEVISTLVKGGVHGVNLEDVSMETHKFYPLDQAVERVRRTLKVAADLGVKDFVVNARCDVLVHGGQLSEVIERGKAYLAAGATSVFVWGGSKRGVSHDEVATMVKEFDGRLNVSMKLSPDALNAAQLSQIGVSRISIGPTLQFIAMDVYAKEAEKILTSAS
ncbi:phosphoenolpyruvate phosphomutase domain-containing protein [Trichoderma evansii]